MSASEFELVDDVPSAKAEPFFARADLLPYRDPRAHSEGDFIGRLRALFGVMPRNVYTLRHRATGVLVIADAGRYGPSYSGVADDSGARSARLSADPDLRAGRPSRRPGALDGATEATMATLLAADHLWQRRCEASAPPAFVPVAAALDAAVDQVAPVDWVAFRYTGAQNVFHVGVRDAVPFRDKLSITAGLEVLLAAVEDEDDTVLDDSDSAWLAADRVVNYWISYLDGDDDEELDRVALERARPAVQAAWFRYVERAGELDDESRALVLEHARKQVAPLRLEPARARRAIEAVR